MDYLEKIIITSHLELFKGDLRRKLDEYEGRYPEANIKPLEAKLELLDETIELIHELYQRAANAEHRNVELENYILNESRN